MKDKAPYRIQADEEEYPVSRPPDDREVGSLTKDVAFNRHSMQDGNHISPFDGGGVMVGTQGIEVHLVQGINEESFKKTLSKATRATIGIEPDKDATDEDWEEMMKGGLQTALETQTVIFEVRGASRTATHQLVRTRKASFHQQSQRASFMGNRPEVRMPESIWVDEYARKAFLEAIEAAHRAYQIACEQDISYQDARFILPEGTTNYILLEYPLREFLNVFAYRGCSMFQWEIVQIMRAAREALLAEHPWLEPYVKITCEKTGVCEFQGWEVVEGQCDFPWATEDNRRYRPAQSLQIDHRKASQ